MAGPALQQRLKQRLENLARKHRGRALLPRKGLDLSSNDYLALTDHPKIRAAMVNALESGIPLGAAGSRLLRGNTDWHESLEQRLAQFKQAEAALVFSSGYEANVGTLATLTAAGDLVFADSLIHASLIDGIRAGKATRITFRHNDPNHLEQLLRSNTGGNARFIVVESLYSMDGDRAPLAELALLAEQYEAHLIVDEAHATGVFGPNGEGLCAAVGIAGRPLVTIHTCGKAWGSFGAFITCPAVVRDYLVNQCRNFIFTTAPPPLLMVQWHAILDVLEQEPQRRQRVLHLADTLRCQLAGIADTGRSTSQIIPIILGPDSEALRVATALQAEGFDIRAIRPPTVPRGSARLRIAVRSDLNEATLHHLTNTLKPLLRG